MLVFVPGEIRTYIKNLVLLQHCLLTYVDDSIVAFRIGNLQDLIQRNLLPNQVNLLSW
jgi:hypothetical protein